MIFGFPDLPQGGGGRSTHSATLTGYMHIYLNTCIFIYTYMSMTEHLSHLFCIFYLFPFPSLFLHSIFNLFFNNSTVASIHPSIHPIHPAFIPSTISSFLSFIHPPFAHSHRAWWPNRYSVVLGCRRLEVWFLVKSNQ